MMIKFVDNANGTKVDYESAVSLMDDEICEDLNREMAPCSEQDFFTAYEIRHLKMIIMGQGVSTQILPMAKRKLGFTLCRLCLLVLSGQYLAKISTLAQMTRSIHLERRQCEMTKTDIKTTRFTSGEFYIDIIEIGNEFKAWLTHRDGGIAILMFGMPKKQPYGELTFEKFCEYAESNLDDHIGFYLDEYWKEEM